jgi:ketosteroid isomerase-like protein
VTQEEITPESSVAIRIEQAIQKYIEACDDGDAERIASCFGSDAVH